MVSTAGQRAASVSPQPALAAGGAGTPTVGASQTANITRTPVGAPVGAQPSDISVAGSPASTPLTQSPIAASPVAAAAPVSRDITSGDITSMDIATVREPASGPLAESGGALAASTRARPGTEAPASPVSAAPQLAPVAPPVSSTVASLPTVQSSAPVTVLPNTQAQFASQVARPVFPLAGAGPGEHVMTVQVVPENLGPVTVRAHVTGGGVRIELFAPTDGGREALRAILPELRRDFSTSGASGSIDLSSQNQPTDRGDQAPRRLWPSQEEQAGRARLPGESAREDGSRRGRPSTAHTIDVMV